MRGLWLGLICTLLTSCYDSSFGEAEPEGVPAVTTSIAELHRLVGQNSVRVDGDLVVRGRVTTSDEASNFYRSFCIEDEGFALEVMAGLDHLHNQYPLGSCVTVRLKDLVLGSHLGVLQVGKTAKEGSGFQTDFIGSLAVLSEHLFVDASALSNPEPEWVSIDELSTAHCGRLVLIPNLHYAPEETEDEDEPTWSGYRRFADQQGHSIETYVRKYARFADRGLPQKESMLIGVVQYDRKSKRFILKLRDENDCF